MFGELEGLIGNTPLGVIEYVFKGQKRKTYVKLEMFQMTGSIKDRVAYYMIMNAKKRGDLEGKCIVEATSGNTGISLSAIGARLSYPVVIFMPDWASEERIRLMKMYGAEVRLVSRLEGGFSECIRRALEYAKENNGYFMNQFANQDNFLAHYETTAKEVWERIPNQFQTFLSGVGSGGTLMGLGKYLKECDSKMKIVAVEPASMPLLSGGDTFKPHQIEGIGDDFIPDLVDVDFIDEVVSITDEDAILMAQKISKTFGLGVGISSGANFLASVMQSNEGASFTVFPDDNKKYLSTNLAKKVDLKDSIVSKIKLVDFKII